jgi:hypothetical protein
VSGCGLPTAAGLAGLLDELALRSLRPMTSTLLVWQWSWSEPMIPVAVFESISG